jgi:hypothetical protein
MKTNKIQSDSEFVSRWGELTKTTHKANLDEIAFIVNSSWWKTFCKEMRKQIGFPQKGYKPDSEDLNHLFWSSNNHYWEAWWKDREGVKSFYLKLKRLMIDKQIREDFEDYLKLYVCYSYLAAPETNISVVNSYEGIDPQTGFIYDRWLPPEITLHNGELSTGDKLIADYWVKKALEEHTIPRNKVKRGIDRAKYLQVMSFLEANQKERIYDEGTDTFTTVGTVEELSIEMDGWTEGKTKKRLINNASQTKKRLQKYKR